MVLPDKTSAFFCKNCLLLWKQEQYCEFCFQVYADQDEEAVENGDGKTWIGCERGNCKRWNHEECEEIHAAMNQDQDQIKAY